MGDSTAPHSDVTRLLREWRGGSRAALDELMPLVYDQLRVIAARHMAREWRVSVYQTTSLVSEAYVKLVDQRDVDWQNRAHFFAIAAQLMRRILVDHARRELRPKHGGGSRAVPVDEVEVPLAVGVDRVDAVALDEALRKLEALDPDQGRIVELRFFGGLSVQETADVLGVSPATVKREWSVAKGWLHREMTGRTVS